MATATNANNVAVDLAGRIVRYADLIPCYNAFIDTRTPGSEAKENFTIIGPGVSENPDQHVHIAEPHGFNIGGARQPPGCVNSQHSHDSAEVFAVMSGQWRFDLGEHGEQAQVFVGPGDLISLPVHCFRGFTNVGKDVGFLFAILGGDDPGRVTWAPQVFELARDHGLVLLDSGRLIDTAAGERLEPGMVPMPVTSVETVAGMRRFTQAEAEALVIRADGVAGRTPLIGPQAPLDWPHGFGVERAVLAPGGRLAAGSTADAQVIWVQAGGVNLQCDGAAAALVAGDTFTVPRGAGVQLDSASGATLFIVTGEGAAA